MKKQRYPKVDLPATTKPRLSYSKINCFLKCRREYYWKYVENLAPIAKADYFQIGIIVHDLRERWIKGELDISGGMDAITAEIQKRFPSNDPETSEKVSLEASRLFVCYTNNIKSSPYTLISPEMHLELDVGEFTLYARVDALAQDDRKKTFRDELKTTGRMDSSFLSGLQKGLQTGISYWIFEETMPEAKINGTLFEILVKTKIAQYAAQPMMKDRHTVAYTKECVFGVWESIKRCGTDKSNFYPSMNCSYGRFQCSYETLCREDTPAKRTAFFMPYYPEKEVIETNENE